MQPRKPLLIGALTCLVTLSSCTWFLAGGPQKKTFAEAQVKANMKFVLQAAQTYANDHDGKYPFSIDQFKVQIKEIQPPKDSEIKATVDYEGEGLPNPFKMKYDNPFNGKITVVSEWPKLGSITDVNKTREEAPKAVEPGTIEYNASSDRTWFAIVGGGEDGKAIKDKAGKTLVLSNI